MSQTDRRVTISLRDDRAPRPRERYGKRSCRRALPRDDGICVFIVFYAPRVIIYVYRVGDRTRFSASWLYSAQPMSAVQNTLLRCRVIFRFVAQSSFMRDNNFVVRTKLNRGKKNTTRKIRKSSDNCDSGSVATIACIFCKVILAITTYHFIVIGSTHCPDRWGFRRNDDVWCSALLSSAQLVGAWFFWIDAINNAIVKHRKTTHVRR